jgi:hypothetical protein
MREFARVSRSVVVVLCAGAMALGVAVTLLPGPAQAAPAPDCGPTRQWNCVLPRCEECPEILFEGTICEMRAFEKATGRRCSPA